MSNPSCFSSMGGESSRHESPSPDSEQFSSSRHQPNWSQIACVPVHVWKSVSNPAFCIDYFAEWRNRQFKVYKRPWSSFAVQGKNLVNGKEEKLCSFNCQVLETGRVEKFSGWIKDSSMIALHPKVAVIQVVQSKAVKLLIVDWHENCLLATYTFAFSKEPCVQECFLSPDASVMLCRQNLALRRKLGHVLSFDPNIRLIQIKDGLCKRLYVIEDNLAHAVFGSGISMDPRYSSGRAVIFASSLQIRRNTNTNNADDPPPPSIQVFDVQKRQLVAAADASVDHVIHHIKHSPDGSLIAALLVNVSIYITCTMRAHEIILFHSDSLDQLHSVSLFDHVTKSQLLDSFPMFSRDSGFLAQTTGSTVCVTKLPLNTTSLQQACRHVIRRHTRLAQVDQLPLPKSMIAFLQYTIPMS